MNTSTAVAVALALTVTLGLVFYGQALFPKQQNIASDKTIKTEQTTNMNSKNNTQETTPNSNELSITDETVGTGVIAEKGDVVTVQYVGTLSDGTVFDSTNKEGRKPFTFTLGAGQVISGWDKGVAGMKVGGVRKLVIPPELGYGNHAIGSIPANSTLTFVITLLNVSQATK